jgi:hypothetical protein
MQIFYELDFVSLFAAFGVGVFNAKNVRTLLLPRKQPIEERSPRVADV